MSTTDTTDTAAPSPTTGKIERGRVAWADLAWVTWRQHRFMIISTAALVLACAAAMTLIGTLAPTPGNTLARGVGSPLRDLAAILLVLALPAFGGLVAVFWVAPLLSREYEMRTHLLVWSQDVSARRWLFAKTVVLGAGAAVLAVILGVAAQFLGDHLYGTEQFDAPLFTGTPLVQLGYAFFGFALGLAASAITRRTLLSMGLTLAVYTISRVVIALFVRPYYQTPVRITTGIDEPYPQYDQASLHVAGGMIDTEGNTVDYPQACMFLADGRNFESCMRRNGIVSNYVDIQPVERLGTFQLVEFGLFTVLAAALFAVTWRVTRRVTRL